MNKDRVDLTAERVLSGGAIYDEVALFFSPTATLAAPVPTVGVQSRRVLCTADGEPFVLPRNATLLGARVVPYPAEHNPVYTGALSAAERAALGAPASELCRNTDPVGRAAGTDRPIKIYAPTDPAGGPNTMGLVTSKLVVALSKENIGVGTHYTIFGEGRINNDQGEVDPLLGMDRNQGDVFPHGNNANEHDAVVKEPCVLVGIARGAQVAYDVAVVLYYRLSRTAFTVPGDFPPNLEDE
jgi:hypothetical protein